MPSRRSSTIPFRLSNSFLLTLAFCTTGCSMMSGRWANQAGMSAYRRGNYSLAQREFTQAVYDDPDNPDYLSNLATASNKQGETQRAERLYQAALRADPSHQPAYHGLAALLKDSGRQQEAYSLIEGWQATQPYRVGPHLEMAWLKRETGDTAGSEVALKRALQVQPNNAHALAHLGQVYQDRGQQVQAAAMYRRSLQANWSQPEVRARLASLQQVPGGTDPVSRFAGNNNLTPTPIPTQTALISHTPVATPTMTAHSDWVPVPNQHTPIHTQQGPVSSVAMNPVTAPPSPAEFQPPLLVNVQEVTAAHSGSVPGPVTTVSGQTTEPATPGPQLLVPVAGDVPGDIVGASTVSHSTIIENTESTQTPIEASEELPLVTPH